jgi:hypothetical protein
MANQELQKELALAKVSIIQKVTQKSRDISLDPPPTAVAISHDIQQLEALMVKAKHQSSILKRLSKVGILGRLFR